MTAPCNGDIGAAIGSMLSDSNPEDSLWGPNATRERDIIESQRVKLTEYINDVTILFPYMQEANLFNRDDKEIINAPVTTTAKVDKFLDVMLTKGPRAIGVFHEALRATQHLHLFNYLAQLFTQAGLELPPNRQMKDEEEDTIQPQNSHQNRRSYHQESRRQTMRKRLDMMSRQCEMMQKEKDDLQRALGDREKEISSLLSTKEHVQSSLNAVTGKYSELLAQLAHWRTVLESDGTVKSWIAEKDEFQTDYDQMEQEYSLQCSELNAARDRIAGLLLQLERSEQMVSLTQEACQKEKDVLKHKIAVQEGEIKRLLDKLDVVTSGDTSSEKESPEVRCEKFKREVEKANEQINDLKQRLEVSQKERKEALDQMEEMARKHYSEKKLVEKENKRLKREVDSISQNSNPDVLPSPQTPHKLLTLCSGESVSSSLDDPSRLGVRVDNMDVFMPAPEADADLGMKLGVAVVVKELKEGSLPYIHGVRLGDEICQVNNIKVSGKDPLEFVNRLLFQASATAALTIRRQVSIPDVTRTLPASFSHHPPLSPHYNRSPSVPIVSATGPMFTLNPQLQTTTLAKKSQMFPSPPAASSPIMTATLESLDRKSMLTARVSTLSETTNSTQSTNKESSSCSSSSEDDLPFHIRRKEKGRRHSPVIRPGRVRSPIVGSPTDKTLDWRDHRMTRFPTIETDYEFPISGEFPTGGLENGYLGEGGWELVGKEDAEEKEAEEKEAEEEEEGRESPRRLRRRGYAQRDQRHTGPLERSKAYYKNRNKSRSMDDLNQIQSLIRRPSRTEVRPVCMTQEMFMADIRLVGGRGYGIFIQTDSRHIDVETGDEILEIAERSVQGMTYAEVVERLQSFFQRKQPADLMVRYNGVALSQVPADAKDNFHVRCRVSYRPKNSILSKNPELPFEKGDILHITNTLPTGHKGFWEAQKVGSKGEVQGSGLVPTTLSTEMTEDQGSVSLPRRFPGLNSPKPVKASRAITLDSQKSKESVSVGSGVFAIYQPIRKSTGVAHPRPVVLLGALQRDIRRHLIQYGCTEDIKFCYSAREESSKLERCEEEDVVERLILNGKEMISTRRHVDRLARDGYHCVLCIDPENLNRPGLLSLIPIVILLDAKNTKTINKIRQSAKLPQDLELNPQEQIDYAAELKRYRQYFTGHIDLQGTMSDVVKEVRATIARQQKSIIWESDD